MMRASPVTKQKPKLLSLPEAFTNAQPRPDKSAKRGEKKNYAERLSRQLARVFADNLRSFFPGILPDPEGGGQESRARTSKGFKKLDVNYSTVELGLALGVSIKTINFPDASSGRYTKNYSRNENELRAEATDYHKRQPWAVLIAALFLPADSAHDANPRKEAGASSFGSAVRYFRNIASRRTTSDDLDRFERVFIGLYDASGNVAFFDVEKAPPKARPPRPSETMDLDDVMTSIRSTYDLRNSPPFRWADDPAEETEPLLLDEDDLSSDDED
jgi:hypothetical protein